MKTNGSLNESCSFTADIVAYMRTFTDIPYSRKIFAAMEKLTGPVDPDLKKMAAKYPEIVPFFESRFRMTNKIIAEEGFTQVLELASGMSPRALAMVKSAEANDVRYVEFDLPDKIFSKQQVLRMLRANYSLQLGGSLYLQMGNVTAPAALESTWALFNEKQPVAIITEGLLRYLDWPDKYNLTVNVKKTLEKFGGVWITPDIEVLSAVTGSPEMTKRYDESAKKFGFDVRPFLFRDMNHAFDFFSDNGFGIQCRSHIEMVLDLVSPRRLNLSRDAVQKELSRRQTFVLTLRN